MPSPTALVVHLAAYGVLAAARPIWQPSSC